MDRQGIVLATSLDVYNVILDCYVLTSKEKYLEPTMQALMTSFPELSETEVRTFIKENPKSRYKVLAKHVSYEQMQGFLEKQSSSEKSSQKDDKDDVKGENKEQEKEENSFITIVCIKPEKDMMLSIWVG